MALEAATLCSSISASWSNFLGVSPEEQQAVRRRKLEIPSPDTPSFFTDEERVLLGLDPAPTPDIDSDPSVASKNSGSSQRRLSGPLDRAGDFAEALLERGEEEHGPPVQVGAAVVFGKSQVTQVLLYEW